MSTTTRTTRPTPTTARRPDMAKRVNPETRAIDAVERAQKDLDRALDRETRAQQEQQEAVAAATRARRVYEHALTNPDLPEGWGVTASPSPESLETSAKAEGDE